MGLRNLRGLRSRRDLPFRATRPTPDTYRPTTFTERTRSLR